MDGILSIFSVGPLLLMNCGEAETEMGGPIKYFIAKVVNFADGSAYLVLFRRFVLLIEGHRIINR